MHSSWMGTWGCVCAFGLAFSFLPRLRVYTCLQLWGTELGNSIKHGSNIWGKKNNPESSVKLKLVPR